MNGFDSAEKRFLPKPADALMTPPKRAPTTVAAGWQRAERWMGGQQSNRPTSLAVNTTLQTNSIYFIGSALYKFEN